MTYKERRAQWRAGCVREARALMRGATSGHIVKTRIANLARRLGWPYSRTENMWRGEARIIEAWEMNQLHRLTDK